MIEGLFQPQHLLIVLVMLLASMVMVLPVWRILARMGYPGPLSLLFLLPMVGYAALWWLAFTEWPLERSARQSEPYQRSSVAPQE